MLDWHLDGRSGLRLSPVSNDPANDQMTITTLESDIKERLSIAYATAVAARAGCELTEVRVDRNGIDVTIRARGTKVKIDLQLKATSSGLFDQEMIKFDLDVPGYNSLRSTLTMLPVEN